MDIQQGAKKAGRPITLNGDNTRTKRSDLVKLQALSDVPELELILTHPKGKTYKVIFARPAMSNIKPIKQYRPSDDSDEDKYALNLHFMTI